MNESNDLVPDDEMDLAEQLQDALGEYEECDDEDPEGEDVDELFDDVVDWFVNAGDDE